MPSPTGFYTTHQDAANRWWLLAPNGEKFISKGVNNVTFYQDKMPATGRSEYGEACEKKYGTIAAWREAVARRLLGWHFNTVGAWSDNELSTIRIEGRSLARTPVIHLGSKFISAQSKLNAWLKGHFPDVFDPAFEAFVRTAAAEQCAPFAHDPSIIGWFADNELRWGADWRSSDELIIDFLNAPPGSPGREAAIAMLRQHHGEIASFNETWKTSFADWPELAATTTAIATPYPQIAELQQNQAAAEGPTAASRDNAEDKGRTRFLRDFTTFKGLLADAFFRISSAAIRAAAPHHLVMGCRFASYPGGSVVQAAARHVDVLSFNCYDLDPSDSVAKYGAVGKPLLIGEFAFRAADSGLPNSKGAGPWVDNQPARADAYRTFVEHALAHPNLVGYHWFEHADEPKTGRFDGEDSNYGLVTIEDEPYAEFVPVVSDVNAAALTRHSGGEGRIEAGTPLG